MNDEKSKLLTDDIYGPVKDEFKLPKGEELRQLTGSEISPMYFEPPGPVGESYVYGMAPIDYIVGPVGSGKTTCSTFRIPIHALRMPACKDDVLRARGAVVHENFRALYRTGLESIFQFFPRDFPGATFEGGQDRPFRFTLRFLTPRGKKLQIILDGFGIGKHSIEELLRGYQCNFFWNVEADLIPEGAPEFEYSRVAQGRYPGKARLKDPEAPVPGSVFGDLNPPLISHYIYRDFVEDVKPGHVLRRQPSGLSDKAENRKYTSRAEYEQMALVLGKDKVRRFVHGEFGLQGDGALAYTEFDHEIHISKEPLAPLDLPIRISLDGGGTPAGVVRQFTPRGHLRVLDELCTPEKEITGAGRFAEMFVDLLQSKYRGLPIAWAFGDPSAFHGADRQAGELSFMEIVGKALNVQIFPTPTNEPVARQEAVAYLLRKRLDSDGTPFFQCSSTCRRLVGGFQGGFVIKMNPNDVSDRFAFVKNKFSHVHEALQYGAYGDRGHAGLINDAARAGRPGNVVPLIRPVQGNVDFNVP